MSSTQVENIADHRWLAQDILTDGVAQNIAYYLTLIGASGLTAGLLANRPTVPTIALFYYATDTGALYYWNGTTWTSLTFGGAQLNVANTFTQPQTLPVIDKGGQVFNVRAYGADPTGATDSTVAIQAAITAIGANGGTVLFPPGTYLCGTLTPASNMVFKGSGKGNTVIKCATGAFTLFTTGSTNFTDIEVCDFTYDASNQTGANQGIEFVLGSRIAIRRCRVYNTSGAGIVLFACFDCLIEGNDVENSGQRNAPTTGGQQAGIGLGSNTVTNRVRIVNNRVYNANDCGILGANGLVDCEISGNIVDTSSYIGIAPGAGGLSLSIVGNVVRNSGNHGIDIGSSTNTTVANNAIDGCLSGFSNDMAGATAGTPTCNTFSGNTVRGATQDGIVLASNNGCQGDVISGNVFDTPVQHGIVLANRSRVVISGNMVHNAPDGIDFNGNSSNNLISSNVFFDDRGGSSVLVAIDYVSYTGSGNSMINNDWSLVHAFISGTPAVSDTYRGNLGYNPVGVVSPAVPGSGTAVAAVSYDRTFYVTDGALGCTLAISGGPSIVVPATSFATVRVPAGKTLTPTFTNAPTWVVEGE